MTTATMEKRKEEKTVKSENEILNLLFQQVKEPKNIYKSKVINVFENAYRINIWTEYFDEFARLNKLKISHSYFCKLVNNKLIIHGS